MVLDRARRIIARRFGKEVGHLVAPHPLMGGIHLKVTAQPLERSSASMANVAFASAWLDHPWMAWVRGWP